MKLTLEIDCSSEQLQWLKNEIIDLCNEELVGEPVFEQCSVSGWQELLAIKMGELMYYKDAAFDYFEKREIDKKIDAIHCLMQPGFAHQPAIR